MNPIYRFQLSADSDTRQAFPIYKDDLAIDYELQQNEEFYRGKLTGKLTFEGDDFSFIKNKPFDTQFNIVIFISRNAGQTWNAYWSGQFWKTDCQFNDDDKTVVVTPNVNDRYNAILAGMDKEYNLIDLAPAIVPVKGDKRPMVQVYIPGQTSIGCFLPGMWWEQECKAVDKNRLSHYNFARSAAVRIINISGSMTPQLPDVVLVTNPSLNDISFDVRQGQYRYRCYIDYNDEFHWEILDSNDNIMWQFVDPGTEHPPYSVVLGPVPGTGATGTVTMSVETDIPVFARVVCDVDEIAGVDTDPIPDNDIVENNRNYTRCLAYDFPDQIIFFSALSSTPTEWGIYQPGQYYVRPPVSYYGETFPIARNIWGRVSFWFAQSLFSSIVDVSGRAPIEFRNTYPIWSVISVLLGKVAPGITHGQSTDYSVFLYGTNPISAINQRLFITPKSNVITAGYDQPAQKATTTLRQILDMLRDCFRCYWFVDDNNRFRIEHISWFMRGGSYVGTPVVGMDLIAQKVSRNGKPWAFGRNQYQFEKPDMAARYQFGWMDDVTALFEGSPIDIISKYVNPDNIEQIQVSQFTSDIDYILLNPGAISKDGFVLLAASLVGGEYKLPYVNYEYNDTDHILQNAWVSFKFLQQYYAYDMPAKQYEIDGVVYHAQGIKKLKIQTIKFPVLTEPNLTNLIKTELGNGTIQKMSVNLSSRNANTTLKYDTEQ